MDRLIFVENVVKSYDVKIIQTGIIDSLKSIFSPKFNHKRILDGITFNLDKGECLGILGANGAGKSTITKILSGILSIDSGKVNVLGVNPYNIRNSFYEKIGVVFGHKTSLWWDLPLKHSFDLSEKIYIESCKDYRENLNNLIKILSLKKIIHQPVRNLSLGERVKGEIAMILAFNPKVVLLDEPTIGLDLESKYEIRELLKSQRKENGLGAIITSHDMGDIESYCDRILLLNSGKIKYDGRVERYKRLYSKKSKIQINSYNVDSFKSNCKKLMMVKSIRQLINIDHNQKLITVSVEKNKEKQILQLILEKIDSSSNLIVRGESLEEVLRETLFSCS